MVTMVVVMVVVVMVVVAVAVVATVLRRVVVRRRLLRLPLAEVALVPRRRRLLLRRRVVRALLPNGRRRVHRIPYKPTEEQTQIRHEESSENPTDASQSIEREAASVPIWGNSREVDRGRGICLAEAGSSSSPGVGSGGRSLGFAFLLLVIYGGREEDRFVDVGTERERSKPHAVLAMGPTSFSL